MTTDPHAAAESIRDLFARGDAADRLRARVYALRLSTEDVEAIGDAIAHCPAAIAILGRVLAAGGAARGVVGPSAGQTVADHLAHAVEHARTAAMFPDAETDLGFHEVDHAAARCVLAIELAARGGR